MSLSSQVFLAGFVGAALVGGATVVVSHLETKPAEVQPPDAVLLERLDALEKKVRVLDGGSESPGQATAPAVLGAPGVEITVNRLSTRVQALEERLSAARTSTAGPAADPASPGPGPSGASSPIPSATPPDGSFSEEQIATFRRIADEVQRRRDHEQQAERLHEQLSAGNVTLTADQEATVLKLQTAYTEAVRDLYRGGRRNMTEEQRQQVQAKAQALRTQFEADLRAAVPASGADLILSSMRAPGAFGGRRGGGGGGGGSAPGMAGNQGN